MYFLIFQQVKLLAGGKIFGKGVYPIKATVLEGGLPIKTDKCGKSLTLNLIRLHFLDQAHSFKFYTFFSVAKISVKISLLYHFEITGDPCGLIRSQQCDLFRNRTNLFSKFLHCPADEKASIKPTNQISRAV